MFMVFKTMLIAERGKKSWTLFVNMICKFMYERLVKMCSRTCDTMNGKNT